MRAALLSAVLVLAAGCAGNDEVDVMVIGDVTVTLTMECR